MRKWTFRKDSKKHISLSKFSEFFLSPIFSHSGITTRHQKDVNQLQREMEKLDVKLDSMTEQMRAEMRSMGADFRSLLEQILKKPESIFKEAEMGHSDSSGSTALKIKAMVTLARKTRP